MMAARATGNITRSIYTAMRTTALVLWQAVYYAYNASTQSSSSKVVTISAVSLFGSSIDSRVSLYYL